MKCPSCRTVLARRRGDRDEVLSCACGWRTTWGEYHKSYKGKQLHRGAAFPAFVEFSERWPKARAPRGKLLLIDRVVHALHQSAEVPFVRPAAVQLIAGNMRGVTALLEELACGDLSAPGTRHVQREWKRTVEESKEAMAEFWARRERRNGGE